MEEEHYEGESMQESTVYSQGADGYGYGLGGLAPFGAIGLVGLGDAFGRDRGYNDNCLSQRITDLQIAGVNTNINDAENHITQGLMAQTNNLGQLIYDTSAQGINTTRTVGEVLGASIGGVKDSVQASQFQTALQTKEILESNNAGTQAILNKLCDQETQALRDALQDEKTARQFAERGLLTATGPNMAVVNDDYRRVCNDINSNDQINILIQNGLANIANQMPALVDAAVARATK